MWHLMQLTFIDGKQFDLRSNLIGKLEAEDIDVLVAHLRVLRRQIVGKRAARPPVATPHPNARA